mmetsp:Transcript_11710/g.33750  ORF Transcript_11710/g.33750 Transcript_11710/m.33750 type:complete len:227 (+) Transcript_11710:90-770(+)
MSTSPVHPILVSCRCRAMATHFMHAHAHVLVSDHPKRPLELLRCMPREADGAPMPMRLMASMSTSCPDPPLLWNRSTFRLFSIPDTTSTSFRLSSASSTRSNHLRLAVFARRDACCGVDPKTSLLPPGGAGENEVESEKPPIPPPNSVAVGLSPWLGIGAKVSRKSDDDALGRAKSSWALAVVLVGVPAVAVAALAGGAKFIGATILWVGNESAVTSFVMDMSPTS